jgi:hypothetical protein
MHKRQVNLSLAECGPFRLVSETSLDPEEPLCIAQYRPMILEAWWNIGKESETSPAPDRIKERWTMSTVW